MSATIQRAREGLKRGFTLVELIITIAIIAILATIGAVSYNSIVGNAKQSANQAQAVQVAKLVQVKSASQRSLPTTGAFTGALLADLKSIAGPNASGVTVSGGLITVTGAKDGFMSGCTITASPIIGGTNNVACTQGNVVAAGPVCTSTPGGETTTCAVSTTSARVYGPGGGQVFYKAESVQAWGQFMEAAPEDYSSNGIAWCNEDSLISGTFGTEIGTGKANTDTMLAGSPAACTTGAAVSARAYSTATALAGSWFLPSKDELNALYAQKAVVGRFAAESYWSSSQFGANNAWAQDFDFGNQFNISKNVTLHVRPVRAF